MKHILFTRSLLNSLDIFIKEDTDYIKKEKCLIITE